MFAFCILSVQHTYLLSNIATEMLVTSEVHNHLSGTR